LKRLAVPLAVVALSLIAPAAAFADTGSVTITKNEYADTPGYAYLSGTIDVSKTTCDWSSSYCGWFAYINVIDAGQSCAPDADGFVGPVESTTGERSYTFGPRLFDGTAKTICLYVSSNGDELLAQVPVTLNSSAPAPSPSPAKSTPPMSVAEGRSLVPDVLRAEYHKRFTTHRTNFHRSCWRYSVQKVRCSVRWDFAHKWRYHGSVTMRNDPQDPANSYVYGTVISRKRLRPKAHAPAPAPQRNCDPNYSGCLNPNASDYDCAGGSGNGPLYVYSPVRVLGVDHFGLDADGDGIGCDNL
jgi:hypothetical protein